MSDPLAQTPIESETTPWVVDHEIYHELRDLLSGTPKRLHESLCYNEHGSECFAQLCKQPEYYPCRTERRLLYRSSESIARITNAKDLIDLGCGTLEKTQIIIHELIKTSGKIDLIPCDIDPHMITKGAERISYFYDDDIRIIPSATTFENCIHAQGCRPQARLFSLLGSTFGNMSPTERQTFMTALWQNMTENDYFLIGLDLVKEPHIIEPAYQDASGYAAQGVLQALVNINDTFGSSFTVDNFFHEAKFDRSRNAIVEYIVSKIEQTVYVPGLDLNVNLSAGERIETVFSEKFEFDSMLRFFEGCGFHAEQTYMDVEMKYALLLLRKRGEV